MIAVFGTKCDCFVFTPWTGLQVKRATGVIENCINKTCIKCGIFDNAIKQCHRLAQQKRLKQKKKKKKKKKKKSGTAESMHCQKSGPALAGPAGPPTTALY